MVRELEGKTRAVQAMQRMLQEKEAAMLAALRSVRDVQVQAEVKIMTCTINKECVDSGGDSGSDIMIYYS